MLISHTNKFLTIDIPKTGTRSYRETLLPTGILDLNSTFTQHATAQDIKRQFQNQEWNWDNYFKYTTIRNPWHRYASYFMWAKKIISNIDSNYRHTKRFETIQRFKNLFSKLNFNDQLVLQTIIKNVKSQDQYFTDNNGLILVNYIGKFENLKSEFLHLCTTAGVMCVPELSHANRNDNYNYKEYYNQYLIDLVADKEKYVIDRYGYQYV